MYKISIQVFIGVDLHKKFHSVLISSSRDIKLRTSSKLKKSFQFRQLSKFYISPPDYQNGMKFFVQIDPDENLYWYFIHLGQIWLPLCLRVITKCMNLQSGVWIYKSWRYLIEWEKMKKVTSKVNCNGNVYDLYFTFLWFKAY